MIPAQSRYGMKPRFRVRLPDTLMPHNYFPDLERSVDGLMPAHWEVCGFFAAFFCFSDVETTRTGGLRMWVGGYNKLTLMDYPGQIAAICFTVGCQLRCPYCHNTDFVMNCSDASDQSSLSMADEFLSYLRRRRQQLTGVVISGGEPLLQNDLAGFIAQIKDYGLAVKLDTNGLLPERLQLLLSQNLLDYVALDYKNCQERWSETTGQNRCFADEKSDHDELCQDNVIDSASARQINRSSGQYRDWLASLSLLRSDSIAYELRTTLVRQMHSLDNLEQMQKEINTVHEYTISGREECWYLQTFTRKGPVLADYLDNQTELSAYSFDEMQRIASKLQTPKLKIICR